MSGKSIAVHSSRGGTGKTLIATNLAAILSAKGFNVAFLDLDFSAPSLATIFSKHVEEPVLYWLNDFLNGKCRADQVLMDISKEYNTKGKFLIGLANPNVAVIQNTIRKSRAWEVTAVKKLFSMFSLLLNMMRMDYCILDTSPGIQYSSINAVVSSDLSLTVTTMDSLDIESTGNILANLYDALPKETAVVVNKFPNDVRLHSEEGQTRLIRELEETLKHRVVGLIPCYCDVLKVKRTSILAFENPSHPFIEKLEAVADKLVKAELLV